MKLRSSFATVKETKTAVYIIDNDKGMSVTNDAEAVVSFMNELHPNRRIFYRDTMGEWGELLHKDGVFTGFGDYFE